MSRISKSVAAVVAALTFAGLAYSPSASADTPFNYLTQQGRLLDETGAPVDGIQLNFTFSVYTVATGGAAVWTEVQAITPDKGYFSAKLGDVKAIDPAIFSDTTKQYFLGIQVGTDTEMAPRQAITSVPFAITAKFADIANSATSATTAANAGHATMADSATSASTATSATNAGHAASADSATTAGSATSAGSVTSILANFVRETSAATATTASAACPANQLPIGGGCSANTALTVATFTGGKSSAGYMCTCAGTCTVTAVAACAK